MLCTLLVFLVEEGLKWFKDMSYKGLSQDADTLVAWNAVIAGYAEHGPSREVLKCIQQMSLEETVPKAVKY